MIVRYRKDVIVGEFCSFECSLRHDGRLVGDGFVDRLLEDALRRGKDGACSEAVDRI
jgi:hypothetical protein